ncbi:MAG: glycerate kinase, partial [Carnobacterium sp.]
MIAIDSMKGSLTSSEANQIVATVFKAAGYEVEQVAIADGGEGTVEAYLTNQEGEWIEVETLDPLGEICKSFYGWYPEKKEAVIEVAASSGLGLIQNRKHNHPSQTSSFGTGQLILSAMDKGAKSIVIGLGGSGTIDGGIGILKALGVEFFDENGLELAGIGNDLAKIKRIDRNKMDQ